MSKIGEDQNYYDLLEVNMGAEEEDIRRAYERIKKIYDVDSLATYGLYSPAELREFREQVEKAFRILIDPENRKDYDKSLIAEPIKRNKYLRIMVKSREDASDAPLPEPASTETPHEEQEPESVSVPQRKPPEKENEPPPETAKPASMPIELPEDAEITGELLESLREKAGIDLAEISEKTKISITNLRLLEQEAWSKLPALVYLRGYILQYSRYLGLDEKKVMEKLVTRIKSAQEFIE